MMGMRLKSAEIRLGGRATRDPGGSTSGSLFRHPESFLMARKNNQTSFNASRWYNIIVWSSRSFLIFTATRPQKGYGLGVFYDMLQPIYQNPRERLDYKPVYSRIEEEAPQVLADAQDFPDRLRKLAVRYPNPRSQRQ
jgi:hypothetical protein